MSCSRNEIVPSFNDNWSFFTDLHVNSITLFMFFFSTGNMLPKLFHSYIFVNQIGKKITIHVSFFFFFVKEREISSNVIQRVCAVFTYPLILFLLISAIVRSFFYYYIDLFLTYLFIINIFFIKQPIYLAGIFIYPLCYISGSFFIGR